MFARELGVVASPDLSAAAELVLDDFYTEQRSRNGRERQRLERSGQSRSDSAKWHRQEVYLDEARYARAREASRRHLRRHPSWLRGGRRLDAAALRDLIGVQHYLDLDLEDLTLPSAERRSEDTFTGADGDVCDQMLLDAPRSLFVVDGQVFDFAAEMRASGVDSQRDVGEVEKRRRAFCDRLVAAVRQALGGCGPLLRAISTSMSQSGLANVERACEAPQVIVSGGEQNARYELQSLSGDGPWDLTLSIHKHGFDQVIILGSIDDAGAKGRIEPTPLATSSASSLLKACTIRFSLRSRGYGDKAKVTSAEAIEAGASYEDIEADVVELRKEFKLQDARGRPLPGFSGGHRFWERLRGRLRHAARTVLHISKRFCRRLPLGRTLLGAVDTCGNSCLAVIGVGLKFLDRARARWKRRRVGAPPRRP